MSKPKKITNISRALGRGLKVGAATFILSAMTFGALLVNTATEKRRAVGDVTVQLCQSDGQGGWNVIDGFKVPLSFDISLAEASTGKVVDIRHTWTGKSEKGCQGSVSWEQPTNLNWDVASGKLDLVTPYVLNLNGRRIRVPISCTTESVSTPLGTLSGKRAALSGRVLSAAVVGFANFKAPRNLFQCGGGPRNADATEDNFVVVFRGEGKATVVE